LTATLLFQAPILAMLTALTASILIVVIATFLGKRVTGVCAIALTTLIFILSCLGFVNVFFMDGSYTYYMAGWPPPVGIPYVIDQYSAPLAVVITLIFLTTMLYQIGAEEEKHEVKWGYSLRFLMEAGMLGLIFTGDFFHIYVMLELVGLSAIILVAVRKEIRQTIEAALKYGLYDILAITIYYLSTAMVFGMFGSMCIAEISAKLGGYVSPFSGGIFAATAQALPIITAIVVWSFTMGSAVVPQHFWLPDAHSMAPSTISAILSGLIVSINIAVLARLLFDGLRANVLPATTIGLYILIVMGALSCVVGAALMMVQTDLKRLIAYSTISNLGLMCIGFGVGTLTSVSAAYILIISYAFVKAALFLIAGIFIYATGSRDIKSYMGISSSIPYVALLFLIGILASIGFPPLSIFWGKVLLILSVVEKGGIYIYLLIPIIISVIFEVVAQIRVLAIIYAKETRPISCKLSKTIYFSIGILIGVTILIGLMPNFVFQYGGLAASTLLDFEKYVRVVLGFLP
jgi:multicomponent Na+:H+ antiporter subunit D